MVEIDVMPVALESDPNYHYLALCVRQLEEVVTTCVGTVPCDREGTFSPVTLQSITTDTLNFKKEQI